MSCVGGHLGDNSAAHAHHRRQLQPLSLESPPSPAPRHHPPPLPPTDAHAASAHICTALTTRAAASPWTLPSCALIAPLSRPYRTLIPPLHPSLPFILNRIFEKERFRPSATTSPAEDSEADGGTPVVPRPAQPCPPCQVRGTCGGTCF